MSVWVRRCVMLACVFATWLVVRPAAASAPLCDEHGASALAPLPVLDVPDSSVDVGEHLDGCEEWSARDVSYQRGDRPQRVAPSARIDVLPAPTPTAVASSPQASFAASPAESVPALGVHSSIERPPRG